MINANYYIAISGRVLSTPRRYFTGFLIDLEPTITAMIWL